MNFALSVFPAKSIWLKSWSARWDYWSRSRRSFQLSFCFPASQALANWETPNCFFPALHVTTTKYCYKTRHSGSTILDCYEHWFFSVTLYSFTGMGFFNQQSHNMPKSGVSLGAVIIFHVKKYTVLISKLICMSCTHTVMNIISRRDAPLILQNSGLTWPRLAIVPW